MLDVELQSRDIQDLHNADAVAAFFAKLRYNTNARLIQTPANLGIVESLHPEIRRCERIADHDDLLQAYLFELTSVTVASTKTLARAFKNLSGDFLLVLTSDYERIDFVLLERMLPESAQLPLPGHPRALKQTIQRPRVLTVERRNPDAVSLRVLRRFTYTEADPISQLDKLKSAFGVADWSEKEFNNRALFADYYLKERLRDVHEYPEWAEDVNQPFKKLTKRYERARESWGGESEKVIRDECLIPTLEDLGFNVKEEKVAGDPGEQPDFVLYDPSNSKEPLAYCLAYCWDRFLDGKDPTRDKETPDENPGAFVVTTIENEEVPWVIVTNGKLWRLYSSKADSKSSNYYEVDLEETLATREADLFRYFWLLFRAESFVPKEREIDGEVKTLSFLDQLLEGSAA